MSERLRDKREERLIARIAALEAHLHVTEAQLTEALRDSELAKTQLGLARQQGREYAADDLATALDHLVTLRKRCAELEEMLARATGGN